MRTGLVGEDIRSNAPSHQLRKDVGRIADEANGKRAPRRCRFSNPCESLVDVARFAIAVSSRKSLVDAGFVHFDAENGSAVHRRGKRLRAAHTTQARSQDEPSGERPSEVLP